jgi:hypothetical protein
MSDFGLLKPQDVFAGFGHHRIDIDVEASQLQTPELQHGYAIATGKAA